MIIGLNLPMLEWSRDGHGAGLSNFKNIKKQFTKVFKSKWFCFDNFTIFVLTLDLI